MKSILVFLVLVAFVSAEPCQLTTRLSGNFNVFTYNVDEGKLLSAIEGIVYIDQVHKRTHIEGRFDSPTRTKIIQLFEERIQYIITDGKCMATPITLGKFQDLWIPANASTVSRGRIGTASDGLNIIRYAGITPKVKYLTTVTEKDCIMTSSVGITKVAGENYIVYASFTDASTDFDDAVFDIPPECREVHGERARRSAEEILNGVNYIFQWSLKKD